MVSGYKNIFWFSLKAISHPNIIFFPYFFFKFSFYSLTLFFLQKKMQKPLKTLLLQDLSSQTCIYNYQNFQHKIFQKKIIFQKFSPILFSYILFNILTQTIDKIIEKLKWTGITVLFDCAQFNSSLHQFSRCKDVHTRWKE